MGERDDVWDAIILGGGAAGLSLAYHLACAGWGSRVAVVDDGAHPVEGRAWAWWSAREGRLDAVATSSFDHLGAAGIGWSLRAPLRPYTYRMITGGALSAAVDAAISTRLGYRRIVGRAVAVDQGDDVAVVTVSTVAGGVERLCARWVFDSVGCGEPRGGAGAGGDVRSEPRLGFLAWRVKTTHDVFEPRCVTRMDFRTSQADGVAFIYVLPTSAREALVERTVFVHPGARRRHESSRDHHESQLGAYVRDVVGSADAGIQEGERGVIPLQARGVPRPCGRIIPVGAPAGMVRASTGYGFGRIQVHSEEITRRLVGGLDPRSAARSQWWPRTLDAALLRVVKRDPDAVRAAFAAMLLRHPAPRMLAFLDGHASLADQSKIFVSLPLLRFARAQIAAGPPARRR